MIWVLFFSKIWYFLSGFRVKSFFNWVECFLCIFLLFKYHTGYIIFYSFKLNAEFPARPSGGISSKYNFLLGEKRASATKKYLAERFGTNLYRMFIVSYGEDKPVALPDESHANAKNRRVTLTIWGQL